MEALVARKRFLKEGEAKLKKSNDKLEDREFQVESGKREALYIACSQHCHTNWGNSPSSTFKIFQNFLPLQILPITISLLDASHAAREVLLVLCRWENGRSERMVSPVPSGGNWHCRRVIHWYHLALDGWSSRRAHYCE
jgi:hypothetical protein